MKCFIGRKKCSLKKKYYTHTYAQQVVDLALLNRGVMLRKYKCQYCDNWHVTSSTEKGYMKKRAFFTRRNKENREKEGVV